MSRKIYILGETTYDIIFKNEKPIEAKVGGSQLNSAVSLGRLGLPVYLISSVGNDNVGKISKEFLKQNNVNTDYLIVTEDSSRVALAFLNEKNDADYSFFNPANKNVKLSFPNVTNQDIILFGSSFAIKPEIREQLFTFLQRARKIGALIVYDPNFRASNLPALNHLKPVLIENFKLSSIVKGSEEDFEHIFNTSDSNETFCILAEYFAHNLLYTKGGESVKLHTLDLVDEFPVPKINVVSTIGAGDNFNAGIIYSLFKSGIAINSIEDMSMQDWKTLTETSIAFAQNVCMSYDNYISADFAKAYFLKQ